MFLGTPEVIKKTYTTINPASLMFTGTEVSHSYEQVISQTSRQDISDLYCQDPEEEVALFNKDVENIGMQFLAQSRSLKQDLFLQEPLLKRQN